MESSPYRRQLTVPPLVPPPTTLRHASAMGRLPSTLPSTIASRLDAAFDGESPAGGETNVTAVVACLPLPMPETDSAATTTNATSMARYGAPAIDASTVAIVRERENERERESAAAAMSDEMRRESVVAREMEGEGESY